MLCLIIVYSVLQFLTLPCQDSCVYLMTSPYSILHTRLFPRQLPEHPFEDFLAIEQVHQPQSLVVQMSTVTGLTAW